MGNQLEAWITADQDMFNAFLFALEHKRKIDEKQPKRGKKKKGAKKKSKEKIEIANVEEEVDFKELLEGDQSEIDDLIDDEEWE